MLRISLEANIEELERRIEKTHEVPQHSSDTAVTRQVQQMFWQFGEFVGHHGNAVGAMIFVKYQNRKWGSLLIIVSMVIKTWNIKAFYLHIRYRMHLSPLVSKDQLCRQLLLV